MEDGKWLTAGNNGQFQITNQGSGEDCYIALYERVEPIILESKSSTQDEWSQMICPYEPGNPSMSEYIGTGEFRFKFNYGLSVPEEDIYSVSKPQKIVYSNYFTIKNKYFCQVDNDCKNTCEYGAVNINWAEDNLDDCEDGCDGTWMDELKCENNECVAYSRDGERDNYCTKKNSIN